MPIKLRVLITQEGGWYIARGLDHCIATQQRTLLLVLEDFRCMVICHAAMDIADGIDPLSNIRRPPEELERQLRQALHEYENGLHLPVSGFWHDPDALVRVNDQEVRIPPITAEARVN